MMKCFSVPVNASARQVAALNALIPTITTARLILRPCEISDWPMLEPMFTGDRAVHIGGPMSPEDAWLDFNQLIAGWLLRGHGALTMTDRDTGSVLGLVLLGHEFGDPAPELGWLLTEAAEGHGYATEAAEALRDWGFTQLGKDGFVSYIAGDNAASIRVAERLGATRTGGHPTDKTVGIYSYGEMA